MRKAWSCLLALATMLSSKSVTLTGEEGWLPMADTTTSFCAAASSAISCAAALMRSAAATHVPPNLCTCVPASLSMCEMSSGRFGRSCTMPYICSLCQGRSKAICIHCSDSVLCAMSGTQECILNLDGIQCIFSLKNVIWHPTEYSDNRVSPPN